MKRCVFAFLLLCVLLILQSPLSVTEDVEDEVVDVVPQRESHFRHERAEGETFNFQAEVSRLMDIIIHSLYSQKEIFLRELISNASDALDKIRFMALMDGSVLGEKGDAGLEIRISLDKKRKMLAIRDTGIGMTKDDLVRNLGTIAKSGTSAFLDQIQKAGDMSLIGQFGVGFYSVYLVADYVEVITKHDNDEQYIWESDAGGQFAVSEDTEGERLGRGTQVNVYLKEETQEYASDKLLHSLIKKYSEFINFPIYLYTAQDPKEKKKKEEEEEEEDSTSKKEEEEEEQYEWKLVNDQKALWLRPPAKITEKEYQDFFKAVNKFTTGDALTWVHFKAEGDVEFTALLFVPNAAPLHFFEKYHEKDFYSVKLYVRRVFISEEFDNLLPRYLGFLTGLIDSDSLPLNVGREMIQAHASFKTMKKKLVRKALEMLKSLADDEEKQIQELNERVTEGDKPPSSEDELPLKYTRFWNEFGRAIRLGIMEDETNRNRLAKLLRFHTSKSREKLTSLKEYVSGMKESQKYIYFACGGSIQELVASPFLEQLLEKDYEVIFFTDPIDEYMMQALVEFDDKRFLDASKEDLRFGDKTDDEKQRTKLLKKKYKKLTDWWRTLFAQDLEAVRISNRLSTTPCIVVASKYGWSANMERIMAAQAMSDPMRANVMKGSKILEINPGHPIIKTLNTLVEQDPTSKAAKALAVLMYDTALLESKFDPSDPKRFSQTLHAFIGQAVGINEEVLHTIEDPDLDTMKEEETKDDKSDNTPQEPDEEDMPDIRMEDIREMMNKKYPEQKEEL
eukprot:g4048.t1